ncbi:hypothetical protein LBMAG49_28100 [Planctomycetota bacterium]|nr:hypothetical protein LBMAG49_28100 [Planctomycetota bacterium]
MNPIIMDRISAAPSADAIAPPREGIGTDASPAFRMLLDSLERLVEKQPKAPAVDCADTLRCAIRDTEQVFQQAMDLRKRLEDAFRARLP